jgi:hypothetical protein
MPKISRLILAILTLLSVALPSATPLAAQDKILITRATSLNYREEFVAAQYVIPRYRNGTTAPAGVMLGGVYKATAETQNQTVPAIVISEDYGQTIALHGTGSTVPGVLEAINQPIIRDVVVTGVAGDMPDDFDPITGLPDLYDGILFNASGGIVENLVASMIPGTGGVFNRPSSTGSNGIGSPFDRVEHHLSNLHAYWCWRGFNFAGTDMMGNDVTAAGWRGDDDGAGSWLDYGLKISGNANLFSRFHAYGGSGPAIWITGVGNQCENFYGEQADIGLLVSGAGNRIRAYYSHDCAESCVKVTGTNNEFSGLNIESESSGSGVDLAQQLNKISGQVVCNSGSTGVKLTNGTGHEIDLKINLAATTTTKGLVSVTGAAVDNCKIELFIVDGGAGAVGADFSEGLGSKNYINIRTKGAVATPIILPGTWSSTNTIIVNGVEQVSP